MILYKVKGNKAYINRVFHQIDIFLQNNIDGNLEDYYGGLYKSYGDYAVYRLKDGNEVIVKTEEDDRFFIQWIETVDKNKCDPYIENKGLIKSGSIYGK